MSLLNLQIPVAGQPNSTEDPKIATDLSAIQGVINGGLDASNITSGSLVGSCIAAATITPDKLTSGSGSAPFLKLAVAGDRKVAWGTGSVNLDGVPGRSQGSATITHGLGSTPGLVLVVGTNTVGITEDGGGVGHPLKFGSASIGSSTFVAIGEAPGTSSNTATFAWLAIV